MQIMQNSSIKYYLQQLLPVRGQLEASYTIIIPWCYRMCDGNTKFSGSFISDLNSRNSEGKTLVLCCKQIRRDLPSEFLDFSSEIKHPEIFVFPSHFRQHHGMLIV